MLLYTNGVEGTPPGSPPLAGGTGQAPPLTKSYFTISHCLHLPEKMCLYIMDKLLQLILSAN